MAPRELPTWDDILSGQGLALADLLKKLEELAAKYPESKDFLGAAAALLNEVFSPAAIEGAKSAVLAELVSLIQTGKSVVTHDDTELA